MTMPYDLQPELGDLLAHATWLRRLARQLVRDSDLAEDAVQDTWVAALRNPPDPGRPARPWLAVVLRNFVRMRGRSARTAESRDQAFARASAVRAPLPTPEALLERHELLQHIAICLSQLDEPYRSTLLLWSEEGLAPIEIARRQGIADGTVRWRLKQGLDRLRSALDHRLGCERKVWKLALVPFAAQPTAETPIWWGGKIALLMKLKTKAVALVLVAVVLLGGLALWRHAAGPGGAGPALSSGPRVPPTFAREPDVDTVAVAGIVSGSVRLPSGAPAPGSMVVLVRRPLAGAPASMSAPTAAVPTDEDGRFRIPGVPPGEYGITATLRGRAPARKAPIGVEAGGEQQVDLRLGEHGALLDGRVLDVGGGPVPRATILALDASPTPPEAGIPRLFQTVADEAGRYELSLRPGRYVLTAGADGYALAREPVYVTEHTTRDLRLMPASRIVGRVVEKASGQPVAGAAVWLVTDGSRTGVSRDVETDARGVFVFGAAEPGVYRVSARKGRLVGVGTQVVLGFAQSAEDVQVQLEPGVTVSGQVRGPSGPVAAALVSAQKDEPPIERPVAITTTVDGRYELAGLLPGRYRFRVTADRFAPMDRVVTLRATDEPGVDFVLSGEARLHGRVIDGNGRPAVGAQIALRVRPRGEGLSAIAGAVSDADGRFEIGQLIGGTLFVEAEHREHGVVAIGPEDLLVGQTKTVTLALAAGGTVEGTVRFESGAPATGVLVSGVPRAALFLGTAVQTTSDDAGRFVLAGARAGQVIVTASRKADPLTQETEASPDRITVNVRAGQVVKGVALVVRDIGGAITGTVHDPEGRPVPGVAVAAARERADHKLIYRPSDLDRAVTAADGSFVIEDLDRAPYTIRAIHPEFAPSAQAAVHPGGGPVRLRLRPPSRIAGIVIGGDERPVPDYSVVLIEGARSGESTTDRAYRTVWDADTHPMQRVRDPSGAFAFRALDPGKYEVYVSAADGRTGSLDVAVAEGEDRRDIKLLLDAGVTVIGRLVDYDTAVPMPGLKVVAYAPGGFDRTTISETDGRFSLTGLPAGRTVTVAVTINLRTHVPESRELDLPADRPQLDTGVIRIVPGDMNAKDAALQRAGYGSLGLMSTNRNGQSIIDSVEAGLPGAKAGITVGDRLLTIDGKDVHDLGRRSVHFLMKGAADTKIALGLVPAAGGPPRTVTLTRISRSR